MNRFYLSETEPDILDPVVISVGRSEDDWALGARASYLLLSNLEVGLRFDLDPLAVPRETLHAINFDFTSLEFSAGAQWQIDERYALAGTLAAVYVPDVVVEESLFDPTAPFDSGFSAPTGNGVYSAFGAKFLLSLRARLGD